VEQILAAEPASRTKAKSEADPPELLLSAASLLRVGVSAFGENSEPWGDTGMEDVRELVLEAKTRTEEYLDGIRGDQDATVVFDALDILTLLTVALDNDACCDNGHTISPIKGGMKAAAELLDRATADRPKHKRAA
jgi:hypothetical protein